MAAGISNQIAAAGSLQTMYNNDALVQLVNAYEIEFIVVSSFIMQVVVLFLAGYRRRHDSPVVKTIVLYSYLLADSTATYGLGHLSVNSRPPERQQLVALWAPFLLHLGGPDSITAYSLEDNKLWSRILQKDFFVQVFGAAYVLYKTFPAGSGPLLPAAWLIFAVGVAKYAERIWALYNGNMSTIRSTTNKQKTTAAAAPPTSSGRQLTITGDRSPEDLLIFAHSQFEVCKGAMVDSSGVDEDTSKLEETIFSNTWKWEDKWTVFQMELSLLYDIMYTKAAVIHTWYGYCLRVLSPLATASALLLFYLSRSTSNVGATTSAALNPPPVLVDVAITYSLLVGAILLDTVSLLTAAGSGWAYAFLVFRMPKGSRHGWLYHAAVCNGRWRRLHRWLESLRLVDAADRRKWSGAIGQYNVLQLCITTRQQKKYSSTRDEIAEDVMKLVFKKLIQVIRTTKDDEVNEIGSAKDQIIKSPEVGDDDFFYINTRSYSQAEPGDQAVTVRRIDSRPKRYSQQQTQVSRSSGATGNPKSPTTSGGLIKAERGKLALVKLNADQSDMDDLKHYIRDEIQEGILIWHIATDVFLRRSDKAMRQDDDRLKAIKLLSNYMMFLVVERPSMVPGLALRHQYKQTYEELKKYIPPENGDADRLAGILATERTKNLVLKREKLALRSSVLRLATKLALKLDELNKSLDDKVNFLLEIWVEMLVYVGHRCSRESHAKKLGEGGEFTTIVWLMAEQAGKFDIDSKIRKAGRKEVKKLHR